MTKNEMIAKRERLLNELNTVEGALSHLERMEKPFVAAISSHSGGGSLSFKTKEKAWAKYLEYSGKAYYRNGLSSGAYIYKYNEDGTKTLIDYIPMSDSNFYPPGFKQEVLV